MLDLTTDKIKEFIKVDLQLATRSHGPVLTSHSNWPCALLSMLHQASAVAQKRQQHSFVGLVRLGRGG